MPSLPDLPLSAECLLTIAGEPPVPTTLFEALWRVVAVDVSEAVTITGPNGATLGRGEAFAICGRLRPSAARPLDGEEATALFLSGSTADPLPEASFRGNWLKACQHVWRAPAGRRRSGFVVSHDQIYGPAWLAAERARRGAPAIPLPWRR